jgi:FkbM family methyltransferase
MSYKVSSLVSDISFFTKGRVDGDGHAHPHRPFGTSSGAKFAPARRKVYADSAGQTNTHNVKNRWLSGSAKTAAKLAFEKYIALKHHTGKGRLSRYILNAMTFHSLRSHYGPVLPVHSYDKTNVYALLGDYGYVISNHVNKIPQDGVFIDIGANYGLYSFLAAARLTHGKVYSFEPNPTIYRHFMTGMALNPSTNIMPVNAAVGPEDCSMQLTYSDGHSGRSCLVTGAEARTTSKLRTYTVPVFNLATLGLLKELRNGPPIHVKIDVEGYESHIVAAMKKAPWYERVRSVIVEIDDKNLRQFKSNPEMIYDSLTKDGFSPSIGRHTSGHYDEIFCR